MAVSLLEIHVVMTHVAPADATSSESSPRSGPLRVNCLTRDLTGPCECDQPGHYRNSGRRPPL